MRQVQRHEQQAAEGQEDLPGHDRRQRLNDATRTRRHRHGPHPVLLRATQMNDEACRTVNLERTRGKSCAPQNTSRSRSRGTAVAATRARYPKRVCGMTPTAPEPASRISATKRPGREL